MNAFVGSKERVRIPLSGKHFSLQAFVKHVVEHVGLRKEAQKRGLGSRIDRKLCRSEKGPDGNKAYAINIQAQWNEERSMFSTRRTVLQGSPYYNNCRYCMILHHVRQHVFHTWVITNLIIKITISSLVIGLKNVLFSTNSLAKLLSDSLLLDSLLSDSLISQSHSKM